MPNLSPVPVSVIADVNAYIEDERRDAAKYENRQPLDRSGAYSLHSLAQRIYAAGWTDGYVASREAQRSQDSE